MNYYKEKVISAREMTRIEKKSFAEGQDPKQYMLTAGKALADATCTFIEKEKKKEQISLLIGKGNNGGDAFTAGVFLLEKGYAVNAFHLFKEDECSELSQVMRRAFLEAGGEVYYPKSLDDLAFYSHGIILDGLLGTGFTGAVEDFLLEVIEHVNTLSIPVISIDIPSGVNGNTGEVLSSAINASLTVCLGMPKIGVYVGKGYGHSGSIITKDFGMPYHYLDSATPLAYTVDVEKVKLCLPKEDVQQHKYQAGYVLTLAGSVGMSGAAFLSSMASLRAGAGIVRLFHPREMELDSKPWEVIAEVFSFDRIIDESTRAGCVVFGPGAGTNSLSLELLTSLTVPTVVDADGLSYVMDAMSDCMQPLVLTPHRGELRHLIQDLCGHDVALIERCQEFVEENDVTLVVKGAPTLLFHQGREPILLPVGNPGMATAGTGDVLSGIIGALIAGGLAPYEAALAGVTLHGMAGDKAMQTSGARSLIASDLLQGLCAVLKEPL